MIDDYHWQLYQPADHAWEAMARDKFASARQHAVWGQQVKQLWPQVRFLDASAGPGGAVLAGASLPLKARIDLAGLSASDVRVEALIGKIGPQGELEEAQVVTLDPQEQQGTAFMFGRPFSPSPPAAWDFPSASPPTTTQTP